MIYYSRVQNDGISLPGTGAEPAVTITFEDGATTHGYIIAWTDTLVHARWDAPDTGWLRTAWMDPEHIERTDGEPGDIRQHGAERRQRKP